MLMPTTMEYPNAGGAVTIENVGQSFAVSKEMQAEGLVSGDDPRSLGRTALALLLEERMAADIERHLERMAELDEEENRRDAAKEAIACSGAAGKLALRSDTSLSGNCTTSS